MNIINGYPTKAPDLVIEIFSESTKQLDFRKKSEDDYHYDVKEYWIVDRFLKGIYFSTIGASDWKRNS